jgi:hypothetical protein
LPGLGARGPKESTSISKAVAHARKHRIRYPALFDTAETKVTDEFGEVFFPNLFLLDEHGVVVATWNSEGGKEEFLAKARAELRLVKPPNPKR